MSPLVVSHGYLWAHALLLLCIVVGAALGHYAPRTIGTILAVLSVIWLFDNKRFEYGTVLVLSRSHGLNVSDFISLGGFVVAAYLWALWWWRSTR